MTLSEIMSSVRLLPAADKLKLIRFLAVEIDDRDEIYPLEHGMTYHLQTPQFEAGATDELNKLLDAARPA
ncbi:MAG: hypothetical protein EBS05_04895 [Proteobacteria bacterium]|nr:hypothetical protein [Pseudomonadota bacterium]NDF01131.1 hypothetical protein [Verrucomicrobiota bacterium]